MHIPPAPIQPGDAANAINAQGADPATGNAQLPPLLAPALPAPAHVPPPGAGLAMPAVAIHQQHNNAQQLQIDVSKKVFFAKLLNLAATGVRSTNAVVQYMGTDENTEINTGAASAVLLSLGVATLDCAAALTDYALKSSGGRGLPMGSNSIANVAHGLATTCGLPEATARQLGANLSKIAKIGVWLDLMIHSYGSAVTAQADKYALLPDDLSNYGKSLSMNIADTAGLTRQDKILAKFTADMLAAESTYLTRQVHEMAGVEAGQWYALGSEDYLQARSSMITLANGIQLAASDSDNPIAIGASKMIGLASAASNLLEKGGGALHGFYRYLFPG